MRSRLIWALTLTGLVLGGQNARAEYLYNLTPTSSEIDLQVSGTSLGEQLTVSEQNPGARTRYSGTVAANFHQGYGANSNISFPGSGAANAVNPTGLFNIPYQYAPNVNGGSGTGPANYGVNLSIPQEIVLPPIDIPNVGVINLGTITSVDFKVALRDLQLNPTTSAWLPINPGTREFDASLLDIHVANGSADINASVRLEQPDILSHLAAVVAINALVATVPDLGLTVTTNLFARTINVGYGGRINMAGATLDNAPTAPGTVTYNPITTASVLTVPVLSDFGDINLGIGTINLKFSGQMRGNANIPNIWHVPEPSSLALAILAGLGCFKRRRPMA